MDQEQDFELEALLRRHVADQLDEYVGRAAAKFENEMLAVPARPRRRFRKFWATVLAGTAAAAVVATVLLVSRFRGDRRPDAPILNDSVASGGAAAPIHVSGAADSGATNPPVRVTWWQTADDEGVVVFADRPPARNLRRRTVERIEWRDQKHGSNAYLVRSKEETVLVAMERY